MRLLISLATVDTPYSRSIPPHYVQSKHNVILVESGVSERSKEWKEQRGSEKEL